MEIKSRVRNVNIGGTQPREEVLKRETSVEGPAARPPVEVRIIHDVRYGAHKKGDSVSFARGNDQALSRAVKESAELFGISVNYTQQGGLVLLNDRNESAESFQRRTTALVQHAVGTTLR